MTAVRLCEVWLNLAADPSDYVRFDRVPTLDVSPSKDARWSTLANGRERLVTRAGLRQVATIGAVYCTREQVEWVSAHVGEVMCYRDHLGRKFFGAYLDPGVDEARYVTDHANLSITFRELTVSEAV